MNLQLRIETRHDATDALRLVAKRLGRSPRAQEYRQTRSTMQREAAERGRLLLLPSYATIHRLFPIWDDALTAAGLDRLGGSRTRRPTLYPGRKPVFSRAVCARALNQARGTLGDPLTMLGYGDWRNGQLREDSSLSYSLPSKATIWRVFGGWRDALIFAIDHRDIKTSPDFASNASSAATNNGVADVATHRQHGDHHAQEEGTRT